MTNGMRWLLVIIDAIIFFFAIVFATQGTKPVYYVYAVIIFALGILLWIYIHNKRRHR